MTKRSTKKLVNAAVDSANDILKEKNKNNSKKLLGVSAMVLAASVNPANAGILTANGNTVDLDGNGGTLNAALEADQASDVIVFNTAATALQMSLNDDNFTIASLTADTTAEATITIIDNGTAGVVTISGDVSQANGAGNTLFKFSEDASVLSLGGNVTNSTLASGTATVKFQLDSNDTLLMTGAIKTNAGSIDGIAAGEGILKVTGDTSTFTGIVGGGFRLANMNIDDKAIFSAAVTTTALDIDEIALFNDALTVTTTSNFDGASSELNGTTILTGVATVEDVTVKAGGDITLTGGALLNHANSILNVANGSTASTITGVIGGATAAGTKGTISITNTAKATFASSLGSAAAASQLVEIDVNNNAIAEFDLLVDAATITVEGTATFTGNATGTTIDLNGGVATFDGLLIETASAASTLNADATSKITFNKAHATASSSNVVDTVTLASGTEVRFGKTITNGMTVFSTTNQNATIHASSKMYVPINLSDGQTLVLFNDTDNAGDNIAGTNSALQDNALTDYSVAEASQKVTLTATDRTDAAVGTLLGVNTDVARAIKQARNAAISDANADSDLEDAFYNAFNDENSALAVTKTDMAEQMAPQSDTIGGSTVAAQATTGSVQGIISNRMASLRSGDAYVAGVSAGNGMSASSAFIQAFGSEAEQKNVAKKGSTVYGFDSDTSGLAIGFDGMTEDGSTVGISASYSTTDVEGKGKGKSKNSIDSYTVSVYADKATENGYIEGSMTYGLSDNNISRKIDINDVSIQRNYKANYDSEQFSIKIGGGMPQEVMDGTYVTPFVSGTITNIGTDSYTETSDTANDNLRLKVDQDDVESMVGTIGVKAHMVTDAGTPMISLAVNNEFGDTTIQTTNTYQGGGTNFITTSDVEELSATLGLGYSFGNDITSLNFNYEATQNDDEFSSHYGSVKIVAKF
jgi:hypothetical protein